MYSLAFQWAWLTLATLGAPASALPLIVHEWGTFTSLQNEAGDAIGGINVDTELLPGFVHNFSPVILPNAAAVVGKGLPTPQPRMDITMRLETPVVYFHLPPDVKGPVQLDLQVQFRGGWLTQYYPNAQAVIDGAPVLKQPLAPLHSSTVGGLSWRGLQVGMSLSGPQTRSHVWLAPRQVRSAAVTTSHGETEQYLFYRGVGHIDAPLRVVRNANDELVIQKQIDPNVARTTEIAFQHLWLVDVRADRRLAFRRLAPIKAIGPGQTGSVKVSSQFAPGDHQLSTLAALQTELRRALVGDGLFEDEADALLKTWEGSYFREPGLRLFFLVPQVWTDAYLPLKVSMPSQIRRVMVGRIEIVTTSQREVLRQLASIATSVPDPEYLRRCGELTHRLGRFSSALIIDEQSRRPSQALHEYIRRARLEPEPELPPGQVSAWK